MNCILENSIFLGSIFDITTKQLQKNKIKRIINCCFVNPNPLLVELKNYEYHKIEIYDRENQEIITIIEKVFKILAEKDKITLINCHAGISRSATIVIGILMKKCGWSFDESFEFVKKKRGIIYPNWGFMDQLKSYDEVCSKERDKKKKKY